MLQAASVLKTPHRTYPLWPCILLVGLTEGAGLTESLEGEFLRREKGSGLCVGVGCRGRDLLSRGSQKNEGVETRQIEGNSEHSELTSLA